MKYMSGCEPEDHIHNNGLPTTKMSYCDTRQDDGTVQVSMLQAAQELLRTTRRSRGDAARGAGTPHATPTTSE